MSLAALAIGGAALIWLWVVRLPVSFGVHARNYANALTNCDGATLHNMTFPEEIEANTYTPAKLSEMCEQAVRPLLRTYRTLGPPTVEDGENHGMGILNLEDQRGKRLEFRVIVYDTPKGPRSLFMGTVTGLYSADLAARNGGWPVDPQNMFPGRIAAYDALQPVLAKHRILYVPRLKRDHSGVERRLISDQVANANAIVSSNFAGRRRYSEMSEAELGSN